MALHNTALFQLVVSRTHPELLPAFHAVLSADGGVTPVPGGGTDVTSVADLVNDRRVVVKPLKHDGGTGVHVLDHDGGTLRRNGEPTTESELAAVCRSPPDKMVVEYVEQADYA